MSEELLKISQKSQKNKTRKIKRHVKSVPKETKKRDRQWKEGIGR